MTEWEDFYTSFLAYLTIFLLWGLAALTGWGIIEFFIYLTKIN